MSKSTKAEMSLFRFINKTPALISLLYDMNLLPEQLKRDSQDWRRMLILAHMAKYGHISFGKKNE